MAVKKYLKLTEDAAEEVLELEEICNRYDGLKGSVFLDTSLNFKQNIPSIFLYYEDGLLISMLSMFIPSHVEVEISALTRPEYRGNGYFKALLSQALEELRFHNIPEILFVCERSSISGKKALAALRAEFEHAEYYMSLVKADHEPGQTSDLDLLKPDLRDLETVVELSIKTFADNYQDSKSRIENCFNSETREQFLVVLGNKVIGLVAVNHLDGEEASIFGLGILPEYRGLGYGKELMELILEYLWNRGKTRLTLEVDSENERALNLYQGKGFKIEIAYDYYRKKVAAFDAWRERVGK
ncbi:GNAT family N-acetyltransferase [Desulfosporosinus sp. PR]|uniref:GNAT family N-acetyltransferase n=1 Tax=Candidatus Desulfosporosinus nitrosoreducens TaxID=3401928 RepID=UPI0027ED7FF4|nr:GNAT family N-acetyltransferase [Desulfosporosinus sp. PR]MDQ7094844.1 GNAT family N-acetyltransferase [Desulfosporosinus sp. PR]